MNGQPYSRPNLLKALDTLGLFAEKGAAWKGFCCATRNSRTIINCRTSWIFSPGNWSIAIFFQVLSKDPRRFRDLVRETLRRHVGAINKLSESAGEYFHVEERTHKVVFACWPWPYSPRRARQSLTCFADSFAFHILITSCATLFSRTPAPSKWPNRKVVQLSVCGWRFYTALVCR